MTSFSPCRSQYRARSGTRAIVPSSFMISQMTPAGMSPARRARSTAASVWPCSLQDAARAGPQREDVSGLDERVRSPGGVDRGLDRHRAVVRRDARRDAFAGLDGHGERGLEAALVLVGHRAELELVAALLGQAEADEAAAVRGHEVDRLRGGELRRDDEVALVLAVLVVDHDDEASGADLLDRVLDGRERARLRGGAHRISRSTYLARISTSTFTKSPGARLPSVVCPSVCGTRATSIPSSSRPAMVSETPSSAIEPFSTQ